jgi:hypothetical protein
MQARGRRWKCTCERIQMAVHMGEDPKGIAHGSKAIRWSTWEMRV